MRTAGLACRVPEHRWVYTSVLLLLLAAARAEHAGSQPIDRRGLDPTLQITQYVHRIWRADDGLPQNSVYAITQTRDGFLWVGTQEGLARFDGVRFVVYDKAETDWLRSNEIWALLEDEAGNLWVGTSGGGLIRMRDGEGTVYTTETGFPDNLVKALHEDSRGDLWIGTLGSGIVRFDGTTFTRFTHEDGLLDDIVLTIEEGADGSLWFGTPSGLSRLRGDTFTNYTTDAGLPGPLIRALYAGDEEVWIGTDRGLARYQDGVINTIAVPTQCGNVVSALFEDVSGALWIGTLDGGACRLYEDRYATFTTAEGLSYNQVRSFFQDREGSLWIGTDGGGLNQLSRGKFIPITTAEGLSGDGAVTVLEDRSGTVWVGTDGQGLNRLEGDTIVHYTTAHGLPSNYVYALHEDRLGRLWIGMFEGGLCRLVDELFTCFSTTDGLPSNNVWSIHEDRNGALWIGTDAGLGRLHEGRFETFTTADGLSDNAITAIREDENGDLWIGTMGSGLNRRSPSGKIDVYTTKEGLSSNFILTLHEGRRGLLWIGTKEGGLCYQNSAGFTCFTTRDGLFNDNVLQILEDDEAYLWLGSQKGISRVSIASLLAYAEGTSHTFESSVYGTSDGLKSREAFGGSQPNAWKGRDGRLWFATLGGVATILPSFVAVNTVPPPVLIESVRVNGVPVELRDGMRLPAGSRDLVFDYTGLSFIGSHRMTFQYQLEGYDAGWIDAGTRRSAFYTNLPPGRYRFRVVGRNIDGLANASDVSVRFSVRPYFYQTFWFYALCALGLLGAGIGLYSIRVEYLRRRALELQRLVDRRTRALRERERELEVQYERQRCLTEQVRSLASALTLAEQQERRRISQVLHDDLQQLLYGIQMRFHFLVQDVPPEMEDLKGELVRSYRLVRQAVDTTRRLTVNLSPLVLQGEGLVEALDWLKSHMEEVHGLKLELETEGAITTASEDMRVLLFQLVRELLFNVVKHAGVDTATVSLQERDRHLLIKVEDQGTGFDPCNIGNGDVVSGGFGLYSVRERLKLFGGRLTIESRPGQGTCATISVPVEATRSSVDERKRASTPEDEL